jgi:hypothetical protein
MLCLDRRVRFDSHTIVSSLVVRGALYNYLLGSVPKVYFDY